MTPLFRTPAAAAQLPRTALIIDRQAARLEDVRRKLGSVSGLHLLEATADFGRGMVGVIRHKPDCVLLGWDGESATTEIAGMLRRAREQLQLVIVTAGAEETALALGSAVRACAVIAVDGLALRLPGVLAGKGVAP